MKIGELAARTGVKAELIRYYERIGLIERPDRSAANYRDYTESQADRLMLLKECRNVGFEIADLHLFARLHDKGAPLAQRRADKAELLAALQEKSDALHRIESRLTED